MGLFDFDTVEDSLKYLDDFYSDYPLHVYEFGVFNGNTLGRLIKGFRDRKIGVGHFWGFDSFEGLPKEDPKVWHNPEWPEHAFNVQKDFGLHSVDEAMAFVHKNLESVNLDNNVTLIPGYFSDTCNEENWRELQMEPAHYIHIDADIYISSYQALEFCFEHWIASDGTLIRFDDIASTPKNAGQHLAWDKIRFKYEVEYEQLSYNVVRIKSYAR